MENKKGSQLSSNGIVVDATHQESNSLDVNENNRDGFDFFFTNGKQALEKKKVAELMSPPLTRSNEQFYHNQQIFY